MSVPEISVGDVVQVDINAAQMTLHHRAEVLDVPRVVGAPWVFRDVDDQRVTYVSEGCTVTLRAGGYVDE